MFQSTPSLRSATRPLRRTNERTNVSIHALLAECDVILSTSSFKCFGFNPRTPCGVRHFISHKGVLFKKFQSTHSLRSVTEKILSVLLQIQVSIHALLAECDKLGIDIPRLDMGFNPRTPCGVRLMGGPWLMPA